jgi:cell division protein FtsI/penicillin-binding protein 2
VVRAIRYESGITRSLSTSDQTQVVSPESAETVTRMLVQVYDTALLKGALKQEHYSIAAKTGTARASTKRPPRVASVLKATLRMKRAMFVLTRFFTW